jgi:hypothetical protein
VFNAARTRPVDPDDGDVPVTRIFIGQRVRRSGVPAAIFLLDSTRGAEGDFLSEETPCVPLPAARAERRGRRPHRFRDRRRLLIGRYQVVAINRGVG